MPARTSPEDPEIHRTFALVTLAIMGGLVLLATAMAVAGESSPVYGAGYGLFIALDVIFIPAGILSMIYLWRIYLANDRTRKSWLLLRDALIGTGLTVVSIFVGVITVFRLAGWPPFGWTPPFFALAVVIVAGITTYMAAIYWLRRRAGQGISTEAPEPVMTEQQQEDQYMGDQRRDLPSIKRLDGDTANSTTGETTSKET